MGNLNWWVHMSKISTKGINLRETRSYIFLFLFLYQTVIWCHMKSSTSYGRSTSHHFMSSVSCYATSQLGSWLSTIEWLPHCHHLINFLLTSKMWIYTITLYFSSYFCYLAFKPKYKSQDLLNNSKSCSWISD